MKEITLHIIHAGNVSSVPPLLLDGKPVERWFSDASGGELNVTLERSVSRQSPDPCDGGVLDEMLREEIALPDKRPVSDVAVIFCTRWKVPEELGGLKLFGLMFDFKGFDPVLGQFFSGGVPREACAVFLDAIGNAGADETVFTAIHELGHVFNLTHDRTGRSFMSELTSTPRHFAVEDQRNLTLAGHGSFPQAWTHLPGGADFREGVPARLARTGAGASGFRLGAALAKSRYLLGESVVLELTLGVRAKKAKVPAVFDPGYDALRIWYETPLGERLRHRPPLLFCQRPRNQSEVSRARPLRHNPRLTVGSRGLTFTVPGRYRVWAEFDVRQGRGRSTVKSNEVELEVAAPRGEVDETISRTLSDPRIAFFVAHKGGTLTRSQRLQLRELVAAWPRHEALQHVRYALGAHYEKRGKRALARRVLQKIRLREESLKEGLERLYMAL